MELHLVLNCQVQRELLAFRQPHAFHTAVCSLHPMTHPSTPPPEPMLATIPSFPLISPSPVGSINVKLGF